MPHLTRLMKCYKNIVYLKFLLGNILFCRLSISFLSYLLSGEILIGASANTGGYSFTTLP